MSLPNIKIYTSPDCVYCRMAKNFFNKLNLAYEEFDISHDQKTKETIFRAIGSIGVPVIDIDGEIFVGFDRESIADVLKLS